MKTIIRLPPSKNSGSITFFLLLLQLVRISHSFSCGCPPLLSSTLCSSSGRALSSSPSSSSFRINAQREATFGMGCFWKPSEELLKVKGVVNTIVGYTGVPNASTPPTYDTVCFGRDWVEGVRVFYDDDQITYLQLLDAFFEAQEPKLGGSRQYASFIFPHNPEQEQIARQWLESNRLLRRSKDGLPASITKIEPQSPFFQAEDYHQKYWQKTRPRIAGAVALLAIATGVLDEITPLDWQNLVHLTANAIVLAGLLYVLVERKLDTKVVQL